MSDRVDRIVAGFEEAEIDALLVAAPVNLRYVTGFTGTNGIAVIGPDVRRFVTDFRYVDQAAAQVAGFDRRQGPRDLLDALRDEWPAGGLRLGFDDAQTSVRTHRRLRELLPDAVELVPAGGLVEKVRAIKEPGEVDAIRAAAALVDTVLREVAEQGLVGRTERSVAVAMEVRMRELGAEGPSFSPIVAAGPHGALPHAEPRDEAIPADTLVTLDVGAVLGGYCSDCTRTWATGESLPAELEEIYGLCEVAQAEALGAVRPGPTGKAVDAVARERIAAGGYGEQFGHALGHGVGLDIHEDPRLSKLNERPLEAGNVVTVEPGIYVPGVGGVRIEDLVVVTTSGREVLTSTSKALMVVG